MVYFFKNQIERNTHIKKKEREKGKKPNSESIGGLISVYGKYSIAQPKLSIYDPIWISYAIIPPTGIFNLPMWLF